MDDADILIDESEEIEVLEGIEEEPEFPMYVVMDYDGPEIFGFYLTLILSVLITYPFFKMLRHALGGVQKWR